jgi:biotin synthase
MINKIILNAYKILDGETLTKEEAYELITLEGSDILDLLSLANKVKNKFAKKGHFCSILNAKSGACSENCKYCAQSRESKTPIEVYPLLDKEQILQSAKEAYKNTVGCFGIVTSGLGYTKKTKEFEKLLSILDEIKNKFPSLNLGASLGNLSEETANELAKHGVKHYNHNIQVNPTKYAELVATSHSVEDRINTLKYVKQAGMEVCSGGILGLGETGKDRVELAFTLNRLKADLIPLNVLVPIEGTPMEGQKNISMSEIAKAFAVFRLINKEAVIKFAAGRETVCKDFQALFMLSGVNGFLTGGYLTTRGREVTQDKEFANELEGFYD